MKSTDTKGGRDRAATPSARTLYEILDSSDASNYSAELKAHYREQLLPFLRRVVPNGAALEMNFLSDPPRVEFRRRINRS